MRTDSNPAPNPDRDTALRICNGAMTLAEAADAIERELRAVRQASAAEVQRLRAACERALKWYDMPDDFESFPEVFAQLRSALADSPPEAEAELPDEYFEFKSQAEGWRCVLKWCEDRGFSMEDWRWQDSSGMGAVSTWLDSLASSLSQACEALAVAEREREEARAEAEKSQIEAISHEGASASIAMDRDAAIDRADGLESRVEELEAEVEVLRLDGRPEMEALTKERDEARAEVARLRAENTALFAAWPQYRDDDELPRGLLEQDDEGYWSAHGVDESWSASRIAAIRAAANLSPFGFAIESSRVAKLEAEIAAMIAAWPESREPGNVYHYKGNGLDTWIICDKKGRYPSKSAAVRAILAGTEKGADA